MSNKQKNSSVRKKEDVLLTKIENGTATQLEKALYEKLIKRTDTFVSNKDYADLIVKNGDNIFNGDRNSEGKQLMSEATKAQELMASMTNSLIETSDKMTQAAKDTTEVITKSTGKLRDSLSKMTDMLDKLGVVSNNRDFTTTVENLVSMVDALERLAVLEEKGVLDKVMKAMSK